MLLLKPVIQFLNWVWNGTSCLHSQVQLSEGIHFCPDCGDSVKAVWTVIRCSQCHAKRRPCQTMLKEIKPLDSFCRFCGQSQYYQTEQDRIELYEHPFAIPQKVATPQSLVALTFPSTFRSQTVVTIEPGERQEPIFKTSRRPNASVYHAQNRFLPPLLTG